MCVCRRLRGGSSGGGDTESGRLSAAWVSVSERVRGEGKGSSQSARGRMDRWTRWIAIIMQWLGGPPSEQPSREGCGEDYAARVRKTRKMGWRRGEGGARGGGLQGLPGTSPRQELPRWCGKGGLPVGAVLLPVGQVHTD
eukprot:GHVU01220018.1.p2 GENE.GHVU01220018.1~~GHVU01220018.1.p2  ORF type:complete len:140 (-),score=13.85 GHVU01220018.1:805-1224(-)